MLDTISRKNDYEEYFQACLQELKEAKSTKLLNSWLTFLNLLVENKSKLVKYAGNQDLVKDPKNSIKKFPIYMDLR